ncbi:MAG TPA: glycerol-3-phosphate dehydrogenase [Allosphingosinicella sp.]|nr:glycerol-3-phosphate dehydrogenase [Allosphingosinicella sp.]
MDCFDLLVIGGGINGTAIARDAARRGLTVLLVEKDDLAAHTSSASSKLIHGGLRYLERHDFRLVRESLREREILLRTAPHIVRPLRFVLPDAPGGRPTWLLRAGLILYDLLAGRSSLPRSHRIGRDEAAIGAPLRPGLSLLGYWDAWVDDARLVVLNALDAAEHGAQIATRTAFLAARREGDRWTAALAGGRDVAAGTIVNAAGPWVAETLSRRLEAASGSSVRLIKGSHIVVPRMWPGDHAFLLQQPDGRVVFALPYGEFSLIGTTDVPVERPEDASITSPEAEYLCAAVNAYFREPAAPADIVWSYAGIRSLHDDGSTQAKDVTRDYRLELDDGPGPKLLSVFGGKITTARALAEEALDRLGVAAPSTTASAPLPGGDLGPSFDAQRRELGRWLPEPMLERLSRAYGSRLAAVVAGAGSLAGLGRHFGADLYEAEIRYLVANEFARTADDILWRRTKLGLRLTAGERDALRDHLGG